MFAKLAAVVLITLCVLPFTQPFATDALDVNAPQSGGLEICAAHDSADQSPDTDTFILSQRHTRLDIVFVPVASWSLDPSLEHIDHGLRSLLLTVADSPPLTPLRL